MWHKCAERNCGRSCCRIQESQLAEVREVHQVGVVKDRGQRLARAVEAERLLDEIAFAGEGGVLVLDAEGIAEDLHRVVVGVVWPIGNAVRFLTLNVWWN